MSAPPSPCLFCAVAAGTVPAVRLHEDDDLVAFLDIHPLRPGHALIIPRAHHAYFEALPPALASAVMALGQRIARAQKAVWGVPKVAFLFTGNDIAHAHAHLVPMVRGDDITSRRFIVEERLTFRNVARAGEAELAEAAGLIRQAMAG